MLFYLTRWFRQLRSRFRRGGRPRRGASRPPLSRNARRPLGVEALEDRNLLSGFCATPGKDGSPASPLTGVVNTYYAGTASVSAGATSISVGAARGSATTITAGDLLLVIQIQNATINSSNTSAYGDGSGSGSGVLTSTAGSYEYVEATNAIGAGGGTLTVFGGGAGNGLLNSYVSSAATAAHGQATFEIVRVPQYLNVSLSSGLTAAPWNGSTGGILAMDVAGTMNLNSATVSVDGEGFRGAGGLRLTGGAGSQTDYVHATGNPSTLAGVDGLKGEGIAGTPSYVYDPVTQTSVATGQPFDGYPGGSAGRGAPGNAGGGGTDANPAANDQNTGGGGGGNGGAGGLGGWSWNTALSFGGKGGAAFNATPDLLVLGGGGGAGARNNSDTIPAASSGGPGGGIVLVRAGTVTGTGTITANGAMGLTPVNDGGGGGGAGGSVEVIAGTGGLGGLSIQAHGATGTNAFPAPATPGTFPPPSPNSNFHGPGGGGGGGVVVLSSLAGSIDVGGGLHGTTTTANYYYGALDGQPGIILLNTPDSALPGAHGGFECATDLAVSLTSSNATPNPGDTVTFTVSLSNSELVSATNAVVQDLLPAGMTLVSATPSTGAYDPMTGNWTVGSVAPGATPTLQIVATVNGGQAGRSLLDSATITHFDQTDETPADNTASVTEAVQGGSPVAADLGLTNTVSNPSPGVGQLVTFTVTVTNGGPQSATNVVVQDLLPSGLSYVGSAASAGSYDAASGAWSLASLANGASATLQLTGRVMGLGAQTDTATVAASDQTDATPADNTASATETAVPGLADLFLSNTVSNPTPNVGSTVTFTVTLDNAGPSAVSNVVVNDVLPAGLTLTTATPSAGTYNQVTGNWTFPTLAAGASQTLLLQATVNGGTPQTDTATVTRADQYDPAGSVLVASASEVPSADLAITNVVSNAAPAVGSTITYTVTLTNNGPNTATNVTVNDALPGWLTTPTETPSAGTSYNAATGVWTVGTLASGGTATLLIKGTVTSGSHTSVASVATSDETDPNLSNNTARATESTSQSATNLSVTDIVSNPSPNVGNTITFTITLANHGANGATNVVVQNNLPPGLTFVSATPSAGTYNQAAGTWTLPSVANGATPTLTVQATVNSPNTQTDAASIIAADQPDTTPSDNNDSATETPLQADLQISAAVSDPGPSLGEALTYTVVLRNNGPDAATGVKVSYAVPSWLSGATVTPAGGTSYAAGTWTVGTLGAGSATVLTVRGTLNDTNAHTSTATVSAEDQYDPSRPDSASVTITPITANPDSYTVQQGSSNNGFAVLANDTDADGDPLLIDSVGAPAHGTATISAGKILYTPAPGYFGTDTFRYLASDGNGSTAPATVTVLVNAPVTAVNDSYTVQQGSTSNALGVLANDTNPDGDPLTITSATAPGSGTATISGGQVLYTPSGAFTGTDTFQYTVNDGHGSTSTATVTVLVNGPVTANPDSYTVQQGSTNNALGVLTNDTDADGDALSIASVGTPGHGTATVSGGQILYTPTAGFFGTDSFQYTASDGNGSTSTTTVTVLVNGPVTANPDGYTVQQGSSNNSFNVVSNDTDADGDPLAAVSATAPAHGTATVSGGQVLYTPAPGFFGTDSFQYTASDGNGSTATATVTVQVNAPVTASPDSYTVQQGSTNNGFSVLANDTDADGDALSISSVGAPGHGTATVSGNQIFYTPTAGFFGTDSFQYTASDGHGSTSTTTVTVLVNSPVTANPDTYTVAQNSSNNAFNVVSNDADADGDPLSAVSATAPAHGTATVSGGQVLYTPAPGFFGTDSFQYTASDGNGSTATATVTVQVNAPVTANPDSYTVQQGSTNNGFTVLANDTDADGDPLSVSSVGAPGHGTASISGNQILYTPAAGFFGTDTIQYTASDGHGSTSTATVTVQVNAPVTANPDSYTVQQGSSGNALSVLTNDTNPDGDPLTITSATAPGHGTATVSGGQILYTPAAGFFGTDSFQYTASDGNGSTSTTTVTVSVNAPVAANPDSYAVQQGSSNNAFNVVGNDTDADGDPLSAVSATAPAHGTATVSGGQVLYTPAPGFFGADSFQYTASDGNGSTATATVTVQVNASVTANPDSYTVQQGSSNNAFAVLANDADADGDPLSIASVGAPGHGTATVSGGQVLYTPAPGFFGADSFQYTASDGNGSTATTTVTVLVNAPVTANPDSYTVQQGSSNNALTVLANDTNPDGDTLSITSVTTPGNGTATASGGQILYTPAAGFFGTDTFDYTVADGHGSSSTATVTLQVNAPVTANADGFTVQQGSTNNGFSVLANDTDADGDTLTITSATTPGHGTATVSGGQVLYTPAAGFFGTDTFQYTASDGNGSTATATVTVQVNAPVTANPDSYTVQQGSSNNAFSVLTNDTDADGDTLSISSVGTPGHGTATVSGGQILYTPTAGFFGTDSFQYTASDGNGSTSTTTVTVLVNAPVTANADSYTVQLNSANNSLSVLTNDTNPDGDTLTITSATAPGHGTAAISGGQILYTPAAGYSGGDSFQYTVDDGHGSSSTATVTLLVNAPVTANPDSYTVQQGSSNNVLGVLANDTDADGDPLSIASVGSPAHGTATVSGGQVLYTPAPGYFGTDSFQYTASDGNGSTATATVTVLVNAPVSANPDSYTVQQGSSNNTLNVAGNDTDADGDTLSAVSATAPAHGTATVSGGQVLYTPAPGFFGTDSFQYTASDGSGSTASATVTVQVNAPVTANPDSYTVQQGSSNNTLNVAGNDTDADGDTLSVSSVGAPAHGTATVSGGQVLYTPAAGFFGTDTFPYTVSDGNGSSSTATVTVQVNAPVTASPDSYTVQQGTSGNALSVLTDDTNPDGDTLTITSATAPGHGTATVSGGQILYTPAAGYSGGDSFQYTVDDGHGSSSTATVNVLVNAPVTANPDSYTVQQGSSNYALAVVSNDTDADGDTLSAVSVTAPAHGTATVSGGQVLYTPAPGYFGTDTFQYTASDGNGSTSTATITVLVNAPVSASSDAFTVQQNSGNNALNVLGNDTDPDGDPLSISAVTTPGHGTATVSGGQVLYTPAPGFSGTDSFQYTASDGHGGTSTATVTLNVNAPPVAVNDSFVVQQNSTSNNLNVLANDTDPNGNPLSLVSVSPPAHGTATINGGQILYTPAPGYFGPDSFTYTTSDGHGGTQSATVSLDVNTAPTPTPDSFSVPQDRGPFALNVLANDTDPNGDPLALVGAGPSASGGTLTISGGQILYTPPPGFVGTDTFTYTVTDGHGGTRTVPVTVTVFPTGTLTGTVYLDSNHDGVRDGGEPGLGGVTLTLVNGSGAVVATTTSAADGSYAFGNVPPGNYTLTETPPAGFGTSTPTSLPVTVTSTGVTTSTFGATLGTVTGTVYVDANNNGAHDPGEPPVAGATVTLTGTNDLGQPVHLTVLTGADGSYSFLNLRPGTYTLTETLPGGLLPGQSTVGTGGGVASGVTKVTQITLRPGGLAGGYQFGDLSPAPTSTFCTIFTCSVTATALTSMPSDPSLGKDEFFAAGAPTPAAVQVADRLYVDALYRTLLGRGAGAADQAYWGGLLDGGATRQSVVDGITQSAEHRTHEADRLYVMFLHRHLDAAGQSYYVSLFMNGATEADISASILGSAEYFALHSAGNTGFLDGVYGDVLGRHADAAAKAYWLPMLQSGQSREAIAWAILNSGEGIGRVLQADYANLLGRTFGQADWDGWVPYLQTGQATPCSVTETVLTSDEFFARAGQLRQS